MATYKSHAVGVDGWTGWILPANSYKVKCCDCNLVHDVEFRVYRNGVRFRARRNVRATAASRRKK